MTVTDLRLTSVPPVTAGMLIRRPAGEVFAAFADPEIMTRFWFTARTGRLELEARVRWDWEMYGVSTEVLVEDVEPDRRIVFDWDEGRTVELRFDPQQNGHAYVQVTETGFTGDGDRVVAAVADSTGGFTMVLCAAKALLEHGIELGVVADRMPSTPS